MGGESLLVAADNDGGVESSTQATPTIQLGFSEPIQDEEHLINIAHRNCNFEHWDGGQIGGMCVWLDPEHIPKPIHCSHCHTQMVFICQLYAPLDDVPDAFHRSLYVFVCPSCEDHTKSVCVLRGQLSRNNPYYPSDGIDDPEWTQHMPSTWTRHTCAVCGMSASAKCPLQNQYFCCKDHQKEYKLHVFEKAGDGDGSLTVLPSVYAMSELVVEDEPPPEDADPEERDTLFPVNNGDSDSSDSDQDLEQDDLNEMVVGKRDKTKPDVSQDPFAMEFYSRLKSRPHVQTQCLRYSRWPSEDCVLWIQEKHRCVDNPPPCSSCGGPRRFEFQILPQMLHYLLAGRSTEAEKPSESVTQALEQTDSWVQQAPPEQVPPALMDARAAAIDRIQKNLMQTTALDWGVLVAYTCTASCAPKVDPEFGSYSHEFAWRQPSLDSSLG